MWNRDNYSLKSESVCEAMHMQLCACVHMCRYASILWYGSGGLFANEINNMGPLCDVTYMPNQYFEDEPIYFSG